MRPGLTISILPGMAILNKPPNAFIGVPYSFTFQVLGGTAPYAFTLLSPTLTDGWAFNATTATLTNTTGPTVPGPLILHIYVHDGPFDYEILDQAFGIAVVALPLSLSGDLPDQTSGAPITPYTYVASGGYGGYSYSISAGALPTGLALNPTTGQVTGTPTTNGSYSWTVTVTDTGGGPGAPLPDSCTIGAPSLSLTGTATSPVVVGSAYSWTPTTSGGTGPYTYSIGSGSLPAGTSLNTSTGEVHGTVTTVNSYTFVIHVVDSASNSANSPSETIVVSADPVALSIYNKIAIAAGGHGAYWDIDESPVTVGSTRADTANGAFDLTIGGAPMAIVTGPRGGSDQATGVGAGGNLSVSRTTNDDLDVPSGTSQKYCLFGFVKFNSTSPTANVGGSYAGASAPNGGCFLFEVAGAISGYSGDTSSGNWAHADTTIPNTNWHFYAVWRDNSDGRMRISIDAGTPVASAATCTAPQTSIPFSILGGYSTADAAAAMWGYMKGDYLTGTEQTWMVNSGNGRKWAEIKALAGH